jgi:hypothetical protein
MEIIEIARAEAKRLKEIQELRKKMAEEETEQHQKQKERVEKHINDALDGFAELGLTRKKNSLWKDHKLIATIEAVWSTWEFVASDESVPVTHCGWIFKWSAGHLRGENRTPEAFDKDFGTAIAKWI